MAQGLQTFVAPTFHEAYRRMREALGAGASVVRTREMRAGGLPGLLGKTVHEITASASEGNVAAGRRRSNAEKRYAAANAAPGSQENVQNSIAYFRELVASAQRRMQEHSASPEGRRGDAPGALGNTALAEPLEQPAPAPAARSDKNAGAKAPSAPETPRRAPASRRSEVEDELREELRQMRSLLEALVSEKDGLETETPQVFTPCFQMLIEQGVSRPLAAALVTEALEANGGAANPMTTDRFREELRKRIPPRVSVTGGLRLEAGRRRVMALVGPTGAGKTTSLAKLAARYAVHERARVALITTDTYRVGAAEQLGVYANIVGLPLEVADEPGQIRSALRRFARHDLVLLDTTGCSHFNLRQLKELKELLDAAEPDDVALVLSASTQLQELRTALANFKCAEPNQLLFTKLDETRRYGALLTLACEEGFPLGYFGVGQDVPDDLVQVKPGMLGDLVLRRRINGG